ncbi:MAG: hypothetical protein LBV41_13815 [Cytophagaceae bacterium]|jgi:hypothetical protein|nr:hypothetical protein [Cytophagaceae bacterium]
MKVSGTVEKLTVFWSDKIVASFSFDEDRFPKNRMSITSPTQFFVFDIDGNFLQTLKVEIGIINYCYDK